VGKSEIGEWRVRKVRTLEDIKISKNFPNITFPLICPEASKKGSSFYKIFKGTGYIEGHDLINLKYNVIILLGQ
jgi:hypothetical protein